MLRYVVLRVLLMVPTLIGITLVTFVLMELAPSDRAEIDLARSREASGLTTKAQRDAALQELRVRYGMIDPVTHEPRPVWHRYAHWLGDAVRLDLSSPNEDPDAFARRIREAAPVSMLLGFLALLVAIGVGVPLGAWLGLRARTNRDRAVSGVLFVAGGLPEFLTATLLLLALTTAGLGLFPTGGLHSTAAAQWPAWRQTADLVWHLALPVLSLALLPLVTIARFLRESTSRAAAAPFAVNLRAWGVAPAVVRSRLLRAGLTPVATLLGTLLPQLVGGSVVVESVFALDGIGNLAFHSVVGQDQGMVMALTLLGAVITLLALLASDLLQRGLDPRVRLR